MSNETHSSEDEKKGLATQMFDDSIAGGAMFFTIVCLILITLILTGVWGMMY